MITAIFSTEVVVLVIKPTLSHIIMYIIIIIIYNFTPRVIIVRPRTSSVGFFARASTTTTTSLRAPIEFISCSGLVKMWPIQLHFRHQVFTLNGFRPSCSHNAKTCILFSIRDGSFQVSQPYVGIQPLVLKKRNLIFLVSCVEFQILLSEKNTQKGDYHVYPKSKNEFISSPDLVLDLLTTNNNDKEDKIIKS